MGAQQADHIVPWGLDALKTGLPDAERVYDVVALGSLAEVKDPMRFLRVIQLIRASRPHIRAAWIGGGSMLDATKSAAIDLEVDKNIHFFHHLDREQALEQLARSHVLLHCARYESFCMALIEAASRGVHVVSTPVGIAAPRPGWQVQDSDDGLADACLHALNAPVATPNLPFPLAQTIEAYRALYAVG